MIRNYHLPGSARRRTAAVFAATLLAFSITLSLNLLNSPEARAEDFSSEYITEIEYDYDAGKSNLDEMVKVPGKHSLVLFYDSNYLDFEYFVNEMINFIKIAEKYHDQVEFYLYDQAMEPSYTYRGKNEIGCRGIEVERKDIKGIPSIAMYRDGIQIDIRSGGPDTESMGISLEQHEVSE